MTLIGFWIIGIPLTAVAVFIYNTGIISIWLGPLLSLVIISFLYYNLIVRTDWTLSVREAALRRSKDKTK